MIVDVESIFRYKSPNESKLKEYGFALCGDEYKKQVSILRKQFTLEIIIMPTNAIRYRVFDNMFGEEYLLVHIDAAQGAFVGEVRTACEKVLFDIANKCFDTEILKAEQTKRVLNEIGSKFGSEPEFLWDKYPNYAVFRRSDNRKWFAVIMTVDRGKMNLDGHGNIEILDLKAEPSFVSSLLQQNGYYKAYHMNKTHWFTICLDGSISDETVYMLIRTSFDCASKK